MADGVPAAGSPTRVREMLARVDARHAELVERLKAPHRKHWLEYLTAVAALLTPVVIAIGGWEVTQRVEALKVEEQREARRHAAENRELQVLQPLLPYLFGDNEAKKQDAVEMIEHLGNPKLAAYAASLRPSRGTALALQKIAASAEITATDRQEVLRALNAFPDSLRLTPVRPGAAQGQD